MLNLSMEQRRLIGIDLVLAVLIAWLLIQSLYQWHSDWVITHPQAITTQTIASSADKIAAIPAQHLFGQSLAALGHVPITNLQLHVTGIVKMEDEQHGNTSRASISIADQPSKIYHVGDRLPDGVKIYAITAHTVILENAGRLEKLPLPRERLQFKPKGAPIDATTH